MDQGQYDAEILAYAGIRRLKLDLKLSIIPIDRMFPQAGQGALGIEICEDNYEVENLVKALDDDNFHSAVRAERALLRGLGGGCLAPIGVYAVVQDSQIYIKAGIFSLDGRFGIRGAISGNRFEGESLGQHLADGLLKHDLAREILNEARSSIGL